MRFKSELSAYFPDYDEVIGNDPKEEREFFVPLFLFCSLHSLPFFFLPFFLPFFFSPSFVISLSLTRLIPPKYVLYTVYVLPT